MKGKFLTPLDLGREIDPQIRGDIFFNPNAKVVVGRPDGATTNYSAGQFHYDSSINETVLESVEVGTPATTPGMRFKIPGSTVSYRWMSGASFIAQLDETNGLQIPDTKYFTSGDMLAGAFLRYNSGTPTSELGTFGTAPIQFFPGNANRAELDRFGRFELTPSARSGGTPNLLVIDATAATHTGVTTEAIDVDFKFNRTVTWSAGVAIGTQRAMVVRAPTYSASGARTITTPATFAITGAPVAAGSMTFTNGPYSFWVQSGVSLFSGNVTINGKLTVTGAIDPTSLTLSGGGTAHFIEWGAGSTAAAASGSLGRLIYDESSQSFKASENTVAYDELVLLGKTQVLTDKTLTTPTIGDFTNAPHDHADATGGGTFGITNLSDVAAKTGAGTTVVFSSGPSFTGGISVTGATSITGKLTVTGAIDPPCLILSDAGTELWIESNNGQTAAVSGAATGRLRYNDSTGTWQSSVQGGAYADLLIGTIDHGSLSGLTDDDHANYAYLLGRAGNQVIIGGTASGTGSLTLQATSHSVQGYLMFKGDAAKEYARFDNGGRFMIGRTVTSGALYVVEATMSNQAGIVYGNIYNNYSIGNAGCAWRIGSDTAVLFAGALASGHAGLAGSGGGPVAVIYSPSNVHMATTGTNNLTLGINSGIDLTIAGATGHITIAHDLRVNGNLGVYNTAPVAQQTISGARDNPEEALADLLTKLALTGIFIDSTTAS
jgi:hypothetical protein